MRRVLEVLLFVLTLPCAIGAQADTITFQFGAQTVEINGVTPRATVYIYGLAREPKGWTTSIVPRETKLRDDDGDGRIIWDLERPFPWRSVWFAVELESGNYGAAAPKEYTTRRIDLTSTHLKKDAAGEVQQLALGGSMIEFIVVRPKSGEVWGATVASRGSQDEGTEVGKVALSVLKLQPRDASSGPAPKSLKKDDVIFALNSFKAEYGVARVGE
jgi:hypothetical protein